jgi:hypothetical protein
MEYEVQSTEIEVDFVPGTIGHMSHQFGHIWEAGHQVCFLINMALVSLILYLDTNICDYYPLEYFQDF